MEKKVDSKKNNGIPLLYIVLGSALISLIVFSPIIVNLIVKIDWFKESVSGGEADWLSFYGSYLGGILGGILTLVGVVLTIRYQDNLRRQEIQDREVRDIKHIDKIMEKAYLHLSFIIKALVEDYGSDFDFKKALDYHLIEIEAVKGKLDEFSLQNIPKEALDDFLTVKENLEMIKSMVSGVYLERLDTKKATLENMRRLPFISSIKLMLECHRRFSETNASMNYLIAQIDIYESNED